MNIRFIRKAIYGCSLPLAFLAIAGCDTDTPVKETDTAVANAGPGAQLEVMPGSLSGEQLFAVCQGCHSLSEGEPHKAGPNLHGIMGQSAASREGYTYSEALKNSDIVWNRGLLFGWVLSAETMVQKTWMVYHNHLSVEDTEKLVDYVISKTTE